MSIAQLVGKTPNVDIVCGNCSYHFSKRFNVSECKGQNPCAICPKCGETNKVSVYM